MRGWDHLFDVSTTLLYVFALAEEKKRKGGWWQCVTETPSVLVIPRSASNTRFWQANLISGLFMLRSLHPGVSEGACLCLFETLGWVYDIKHIKRLAWSSECLLALHTGYLSSFPQRVRTVSGFFCAMPRGGRFSWGWCLPVRAGVCMNGEANPTCWRCPSLYD